MKKIGMMILLAPLAITGCLAQEGDPSDPSGEVTNEARVAPTADLAFGSATVNCNSGWPGTRGCVADITSPTDISPLIPPDVRVSAGTGDRGHSLSQLGPRSFRFVATIAEGDAFNPGKNNTTYVVTWLRN